MPALSLDAAELESRIPRSSTASLLEKGRYNPAARNQLHISVSTRRIFAQQPGPFPSTFNDSDKGPPQKPTLT